MLLLQPVWSMVHPEWEFCSGLCQSPFQLQSPGAKCQHEKHRNGGQTLWGVMTNNLWGFQARSVYILTQFPTERRFARLGLLPHEHCAVAFQTCWPAKRFDGRRGISEELSPNELYKGGYSPMSTFCHCPSIFHPNPRA